MTTWDDWTRNVTDEFKSIPTEEIKRIVKERTLPFAVLMVNTQGDYNLGTVLRTGNALGAREIFYYGRKRWDRRGACGVMNYSDLIFLPNFEDIVALKSKYRFVGLEQNERSQNLRAYQFKPNTLIVAGEENCGLSSEVLDLCDDVVEIKQRGSVRSMNVGVAAGIAMFECAGKLNG